jgi:uncharacterized protein YqgC (DUF456 family)
MADILIFGISFFCLLLGFFGSFLPVIPGPVLTFVGVCIIHFLTDFHFENSQMIGYLILTVLVFLSDYFMHYFSVKRFGGGKNAIYGTMIGVIIGCFFSPLGLILGPFIGTFIGAIRDNKDKQQSLTIAFGSLMGFVMGTLIKIVFSIYIIYVVVDKIWFSV